MGRIQFLVRVQHMLTFITSLRTLQGEKNHGSAGQWDHEEKLWSLLMPCHFFPDLTTGGAMNSAR